MFATTFRLVQASGLYSCGPGQFGHPILSFGAAQSVNDLAELSRPGCSVAWARAMREVLWFDTFAYVPAYLTMILTGLFALWTGDRDGSRFKAVFGSCLVLLGAAADWMENSTQNRLIDGFPGTTQLFEQLHLASSAKFVATGLSIAVLGWTARSASVPLKWPGTIFIVSGVIAAVSATHFPALTLLALASALVTLVTLSIAQNRDLICAVVQRFP
jgi:hypothetical protein